MTSAVTQKHVVSTTTTNPVANTVNNMKYNLSLDDSVCADFIDIDAIKQFLGPAVQIIDSSTSIKNDNSEEKKAVAENRSNNSIFVNGNKNNITRKQQVNRVKTEKDKNNKLHSNETCNSKWCKSNSSVVTKEEAHNVASTTMMTSTVPYNKFCYQPINISHKSNSSKHNSNFSSIRHNTHPSMDDYEYKYTLHPSCFYNRDTYSCQYDDNAYNINNNISNNDKNDAVLSAMRQGNHYIFDEKINTIKHNNYKRNWNETKILRETGECFARNVNEMLTCKDMTNKTTKGCKSWNLGNDAQEQMSKEEYTINSPLKSLSKSALANMNSDSSTNRNTCIIDERQCSSTNKLESIYTNHSSNDNSNSTEAMMENVPIKEYHHAKGVNTRDTNIQINNNSVKHTQKSEFQCTELLNLKTNNVNNWSIDNRLEFNKTNYFKPSYAAQSVLVNDASVVLRSHYFLPDDPIATTSAHQTLNDKHCDTREIPIPPSDKVSKADTSSNNNNNESLQNFSSTSTTTKSPWLLQIPSSEPHQNTEHLSPAAKMLLSAILYIKALGGFSLLISAKPLDNTEYDGYEDCIEMTFLHPLHDKYSEVSFCTTDVSYANVNDGFAATPVRSSTFLNKADSIMQGVGVVDSKLSKGKRFAEDVSKKRSEAEIRSNIEKSSNNNTFSLENKQRNRSINDTENVKSLLNIDAHYNNNSNSNSNNNNSNSRVMKVIIRAVMSHKKYITMFGKIEIVHVLPALPFQTSLQRDYDNMYNTNYTDLCTNSDQVDKHTYTKKETSAINKNLSQRLQLSADDVLFKYAVDDMDAERNAHNHLINDNANIPHSINDNTEAELRRAWDEFVTDHSAFYEKELVVAFLEGNMSFGNTNCLPEAVQLEEMRYNLFSAAAPLLSESAMNRTHCKLHSLSDESCYKTCTNESNSVHKNTTIETDTQKSFADDVQAMHEYKPVNAEHLSINDNKHKDDNNVCCSDYKRFNYGKVPNQCSANCYSDSIFNTTRFHDCTNLHPYCPITIAESTLQKHERQVRKRRCRQVTHKRKTEHSIYDFRRMRLQRFYFELKNAIDNILKCQLDLERQFAL